MTFLTNRARVFNNVAGPGGVGDKVDRIDRSHYCSSRYVTTIELIRVYALSVPYIVKVMLVELPVHCPVVPLLVAYT